MVTVFPVSPLFCLSEIQAVLTWVFGSPTSRLDKGHQWHKFEFKNREKKYSAIIYYYFLVLLGFELKALRCWLGDPLQPFLLWLFWSFFFFLPRLAWTNSLLFFCFSAVG
jgi:hypothetical protein